MTMDDDRDESALERLDRNLVELLQELRVAQAGVQILFAFLLALPFTARFATISSFQQAVYMWTLLFAAASTAFLIAPVAYHRLVFRRHDKRRLVFDASKLALAGLACLGISAVSAIFFVTDVLYRGGTVIPVVAGMAALYVGLWVGLPLVRRGRGMR